MMGYVLKIDRSKYYGKIRHEMVSSAVKNMVHDERACQEVDRIIRSFYDGEKRGAYG